MSISWIVMNYCYFMFPLTCNLLGISMPYVLCSSKNKPQNSSFNKIIFSWGKCWQLFCVQRNAKLKFQIDSWDNNFSILNTKRSKCPTFRFLFWKVYSFFLTLIFPFHQQLVSCFHLKMQEVALRSTHP